MAVLKGWVQYRAAGRQSVAAARYASRPPFALRFKVKASAITHPTTSGRRMGRMPAPQCCWRAGWGTAVFGKVRGSKVRGSSSGAGEQSEQRLPCHMCGAGHAAPDATTSRESPIPHLPGLQGADPVRPQLGQLPLQLLQRRNCAGGRAGRNEAAVSGGGGGGRRLQAAG